MIIHVARVIGGQRCNFSRVIKLLSYIQTVEINLSCFTGTKKCMLIFRYIAYLKPEV